MLRVDYICFGVEWFWNIAVPQATWFVPLSDSVIHRMCLPYLSSRINETWTTNNQEYLFSLTASRCGKSVLRACHIKHKPVNMTGHTNTNETNYSIFFILTIMCLHKVRNIVYQCITRLFIHSISHILIYGIDFLRYMHAIKAVYIPDFSYFHRAVLRASPNHWHDVIRLTKPWLIT